MRLLHQLALALNGVVSLLWHVVRRLLTTWQGFILGEGFLSIVNLIMQSIGIPHL